MGWKDTAKGAMDSAKGAMDSAAKVAKDAATDARDKGDEMMLKRKRDGLAQELGYALYDQKQGMENLDEHIDKLVGEMRALNAEIDAIKGPES